MCHLNYFHYGLSFDILNTEVTVRSKMSLVSNPISYIIYDYNHVSISFSMYFCKTRKTLITRSAIMCTLQSPVLENPPTVMAVESANEQDVVFDDSGVSDVTTSSNNSSNSAHATCHMTSHDSSSSNEESISTSEKWAQASKYCADAKDYLEMMCHDLAEELSHFDLQKEKELKQVLLDYASTQQERHEKVLYTFSSHIARNILFVPRST